MHNLSVLLIQGIARPSHMEQPRTNMSNTTLSLLWQRGTIRKNLSCYLMRNDLASCRLVCRDLAVQLAPLLFSNITIVFRCRAFTRPSRLVALARIGHHIQDMTFKIPHTAETFLPPVIDLVTGTEQTFVYMPQHRRGASQSLRYGSPEITNLLVKQYPPLFHAATDIPSFVHVLSLMKNLRHLRITCEGQPGSHRYRRSVVDYALISLRMAVELAPLKCLASLSLLSVHPAAVLYLQPNLAFGASPGSRKRWAQIQHLTIHMTSFPHERGEPTDHFKLLHAYLQSFPQLRELVFHWERERSLSPFSLATELCLQSSTRYPPSRRGWSWTRSRSPRPLRFPLLHKIELVNAITDAGQIATFLFDHRQTLRDCNFQDIALRTGTWDEALAPLTRLNSLGQWKDTQGDEETVDVPIVLSSTGVRQQQQQQGTYATERQKEGLCSLARARARERIWGKPDHMKQLLPSSVFSWR